MPENPKKPKKICDVFPNSYGKLNEEKNFIKGGGSVTVTVVSCYSSVTSYTFPLNLMGSDVLFL